MYSTYCTPALCTLKTPFAFMNLLEQLSLKVPSVLCCIVYSLLNRYGFDCSCSVVMFAVIMNHVRVLYYGMYQQTKCSLLHKWASSHFCSSKEQLHLWKGLLIRHRRPCTNNSIACDINIFVNVKICGPYCRRSNKNKRDETKAAEETDRQAEPVDKGHDR